MHSLREGYKNHCFTKVTITLATVWSQLTLRSHYLAPDLKKQEVLRLCQDVNRREASFFFSSFAP